MKEWAIVESTGVTEDVYIVKGTSRKAVLKIYAKHIAEESGEEIEAVLEMFEEDELEVRPVVYL